MAKAPITQAPGVGPAPRPKATPLQTITYQGMPLGMITAVAKHEIPDGGAFYLQDILLEQPGIVRRRGPLTSIQGMVAFTNPIFGAAACYSPANVFKAAILEGTGSNGYLSVLSSNLGSKTQIAWPNGFATAPYPVVDIGPLLGGGALIGVSTQYDEASPTQGLAVWRGGANPNYSTGTITVTQGSTAVTGSGTVWTTNASPGMFLFDGSNHYIGTVKAVNNDSSITLEHGALQALSAAAYVLQSLRGINPWVTTGEITVSTTATAVTGQNTKFKERGLDTGTWDIYRARDFAFVGRVASVTNDTSITLAANGAVAMSVENYIAIRYDGDWNVNLASGDKVGFLSAPYASRQFYANLGQTGKSSYLWFSEENLPDCIDTSPLTGDFIPVSSGSAKSAQTPIKAIMPGFNSLLIAKDDETFALIGTDPENFQVKKVWDDGALAGMSVQQWRDTVIFAGHNGVYAWDGTTINDLMKDTLGPEYRAAVKNFDPTTYRMWSAIVRDHYFLFIENVTPRIGVTKGNTTTDPSRWTIIINMLTGAVTLGTNLDFRGTLVLPSNQSYKTWLLINTSSGGAVCDGDALFDSTGNDAFTCAGNSVGPQFYLDSKLYSLGDPLRRKLIKQIAMHYQSFGDGLTIDTVVGLGTVGTGTTNTVSFPATSSWTWDLLGRAYSSWSKLAGAFPTWNSINVNVWGKRRYKFLKHDNFLGFRLYQDSNNVTAVQIGPFQLGFKVQAPGRI